MTREIVQKEGIWVGNSAGSALAGLIQMKDQLTEKDVVVIVFHDHGTRYLAKIFNDDWMRKMGYIDKKGMTAKDVLANRKNIELVTLDKKESISHALKIMNENNFSQIPVSSDDRIVGALYENQVYDYVLKNPHSKDEPIEKIMREALPFVDISTPLDELSGMITGDRMAVLLKDFKAGRTFILTKSDIVDALVK